MAWVKIDDRMINHPKIESIGVVGLGLHVAALCYANQHLTDGFISRKRVPLLIDMEEVDRRWDDATESYEHPALKWAAILVQAGVWEEAEGGFRIHDYLKYQPSRREVETQRQRLSTMRAAAGHQGGKQMSSTPASKRAANRKQTGKQMSSKPEANREANEQQTGSKPEANEQQTGSKPEANEQQTGSKPGSKRAANEQYPIPDTRYPIPDTRDPEPAAADAAATRARARAREAAAAGTERDPNLAKALTAFENLTGALNPVVIGHITEWVDSHQAGAEWVDAACEEAALNNGRSWNYVKAILDRWQRDGFRANRRSHASTAKFATRRVLPGPDDWQD